MTGDDTKQTKHDTEANQQSPMLFWILRRFLFFFFFFCIASFQEQWRDWGGIMGWFVPFLLPWDKQQLESSSTAQYLEQTIPSDCINCSEIRLNESTKKWWLYVFGLLCSLDIASKMKADGVAVISNLCHCGSLITSSDFSPPQNYKKHVAGIGFWRAG